MCQGHGVMIMMAVTAFEASDTLPSCCHAKTKPPGQVLLAPNHQPKAQSFGFLVGCSPPIRDS